MRIEPDVMSDLDKNNKEGKQGLEADQGNNSGPGVTTETEKGDIEIQGTPDYMGGFPADGADRAKIAP